MRILVKYHQDNCVSIYKGALVADLLKGCLYLLAVHTKCTFLMLTQCMLLCFWVAKLLFRILLLIVLSLLPNLTIYLLTYLFAMRNYRYFRDVIFSSGNITLRFGHEVIFCTTNFSRIIARVYLNKILILKDARSSYSM